MTPRIALISGGIPLGGSTTFLLNLAGELVRRNLPILVVSLEADNPYETDFRLRQIPLQLEDDCAFIFEDRLDSALRRVREFQPTVVVACLGPSSFEILRYLPAGIIRLGMIQSDFPENYPPFVPYIPFLDGMIGVSREIEAKLSAHPQFGSIPTYYLPYGIEVPLQPPARTPRRVELGEAIRILYFGRIMRPQKRVHLFPEILRLLEASGLSFAWTIAGDGPELEWLKLSLTSKSENVSVQFVGPVKYVEVPELLSSHDIFLLASDAEGLPLSLLEAMAYGLVPVISEIKSGVSEVVNPDVAMIVPPDRTDGYAEAIVTLGCDPTRLVGMATQAALAVRKTYSVQGMTDRWLKLIEELTREQQIRPWSWFRVKAPLAEAGSIRFSPPMRILRRQFRRFSVARPRSSQE